jgi:hypothetical protein
LIARALRMEFRSATLKNIKMKREFDWKLFIALDLLGSSGLKKIAKFFFGELAVIQKKLF